MAVFPKQKAGGFMDEIRCDEPSYLIWKWHPAGSQAGNNRRENAIRWGSSLRVKAGEVAVFVYGQDDGTMQDFIVGPFDETIQTANFPVLAELVGAAFGGGTPFQAEVYFINLAKIIQVRFAVPYFDVYDPRFSDFGVPVAVRGTISFQITDYKEFVQLHRLTTFQLEDFQLQIRDAVSRYVKDVVANAPAANNIPLVQIETKTAMINDVAELNIRDRLAEDFGVQVSGVDISSIELDKTSDSYQQLMSVTRDLAGATARAETEARLKDIAAKQRIEAEHYEETLRIQREEGQYATHKQTQSSNMGAFQVETQGKVGVAGAEALGKMGAAGGGNIDPGTSGGFNPVTMMAGMAVGGAIGQNIAGTIHSFLPGTPQTATPPPVPQEAYHVAVNGQATGPYPLPVLQQMAAAGTLNGQSLVWKNGMPAWEHAENVPELKGLFGGSMPPIPDQ